MAPRDKQERRGSSPLQRSRAVSGSPTLSLGYVLEWSSGPTQTRQRRHVLSNAEELRTELLAGECCPGSGRMAVVRGRPDREVAEVLRGVGGVDGDFLARHAEGRAYRPRGKTRKTRWWRWAYPDGRRQDVSVCRASLWLASQVPILLLDHPAAPSVPLRTAPKLRHQDAATSRLAAQAGGGGPYGAAGTTSPPGRAGDTSSSFEEDLWDALVLVGGTGDASVEEMLAELVYERWTDFLAGLRLDGGPEQRATLWRALAALEGNLDEAKALARHGRVLDAVSPAAWADLLQRLHTRIHLTPPPPVASPPPPEYSSADRETDLVNQHSLNRIAYLGGILLPLTVVAGVLSIEGDYGPAGRYFWVFWVVSLAASLAALLVIYADDLRSLPVWSEVDDDDDGSEDEHRGEDVGEGERESLVRPAARYLVQRWRDGSTGRTWRRGQLGWAGAVKKMVGYYRWRRDSRVRFERPGEFRTMSV